MQEKQLTNVRVRFAPSPTGHLHIGGLRAAIFNWLFARHHKGVFLLRIEDTDRERSKQEYTDAIIDTFEWMGISSDEPLVIQSERIDEHIKVIKLLLDQKKAYRCYCSQEEVLKRHVDAGGDAQFVKYDGRCRSAFSVDESREHAIRFAIPESVEDISFEDMIRGPISVAADELDDFIIARSDYSPMYNFVVVVDDAFMGITHVIRGEDHISNTPKQILLYRACGYTIPQFAHAPNILGSDGKKLSKREAAASVLDYRRMGYLPQALCNYLVRLGWSHGDQEIFSQQELINYFSLESVGKKGSIFDKEKLDWLNGMYIRNSNAYDLYQRIILDVEPDLHELLSAWDQSKIPQAIALYQDRVKTLQELVANLLNLYKGASVFNKDIFDQAISFENIEGSLSDVLEKLPPENQFTIDYLKDSLNLVAKQRGVKLASIAQPLRIALLGSHDGPGVLGILAFLGKKESVIRINELLKWLQGC